jgi:nucleoid-associated protein YgaU
LVAVGIAAGAVGGYALGDWRNDHRPSSAESLTRLQAQQEQIGRLRQALQQARQAIGQNEARLRDLQGKLDAAKEALREARRKVREAGQVAPTTFLLHYRVRTGDTLWDLARAFYGDARAWPKILHANRASIADPDRLTVGQVLDITVNK